MQSLRCRLMWSKLILLDLVFLVVLVDAIIPVKSDVEQTDPAGSGFLGGLGACNHCGVD